MNGTTDLPGAARRPRKGRTVAIVVALALLLAAVGGGVAWVSYTRSPGHSLALLTQAAQGKDWDGVQKYVDVDSVVSQAVDAAVARNLGDDTVGLGALAAGLTQAMKPTLVQQAKDSLRKSVEQGKVPATGGQPGAAYIFAAKQVKSVTYIGDMALVTVDVPQKSGPPFALRLKMKRVDDFWRVTAIENILDLPNSPLK